LFLLASAVGEAAFHRCRDAACLEEVVKAFDVDDVLEALNVIETLQIVCTI
jgi:hypothetical protein